MPTKILINYKNSILIALLFSTAALGFRQRFFATTMFRSSRPRTIAPKTRTRKTGTISILNKIWSPDVKENLIKV